MTDTFFFPPESKQARISMVYMPDGPHKLALAREKAQGGDPANYRKGAKYAGPELALFSTATDLFHFYQMLADRGTYQGKRILSAQAVEAMTHDYTPDHQNYGLTLSILDGTHTLFHLINPGTFGHGGAFGSIGLVDPKNGLIMIFLAQMVGGPTLDARNIFCQLAESSVR
jgi:CubicO group peptidase (beta-lactamase class C family)